MAIGGAMANTFLFAKAGRSGARCASPIWPISPASSSARPRSSGCDIILPEDAVTAEKLEAGALTRTVGVHAVPMNAMILDIGPQTVARIGRALENSRTLVWNGPVGAFETPPFDRATIAIAKKIAELTRAGTLMSVAGGGDTVAALAAAGVTDDLTYVSTAGGAFLEWLEGRELPGVTALAVG